MNSLLPNSDLKKVGKTTRPFRYDLIQIPYNYPVEVTDRFKGLDLIECLKNNKLWKILKEMGIPDHLTCLLRNLYAGQEATELDMEQRTGSNWERSKSRLYIVTLLF